MLALEVESVRRVDHPPAAPPARRRRFGGFAGARPWTMQQVESDERRSRRFALAPPPTARRKTGVLQDACHSPSKDVLPDALWRLASPSKSPRGEGGFGWDLGRGATEIAEFLIFFGLAPQPLGKARFTGG